MNVMDFREVFLAAQSDAADIVREAIDGFYRPDRELELALHASTLPLDAWQYVDPEIRRQILEVFNAA